MCVEIHTEGPPHPFRNMYLSYIHVLLVSSMSENFYFKWRLIGDVVALSTTPAAGEGILTHLLCVSLVSPKWETVSKMCLFKVGQYCLTLLNSPQEEAYKQLFRGLLV